MMNFGTTDQLRRTRQAHIAARVITLSLICPLLSNPARAESAAPGGSPSGASDPLIEFLRRAIDTSGFTPQWDSSNWSHEHGWLEVGSAFVIGIACLAMGLALLHLARRRSGHAHCSPIYLFAFFILFNGITCLLNASMFWWPAYRLTALITTATAVLALIAFLSMIPMIPRLVSLRSSVELQREIVQRHRTEMELRQVHAQLEGVIEHRTAQLASKNREMEQFLNTVSHDLKSPLVTCIGLTSMLREEIHEGRLQETADVLDRIDRSMTRMRNSIEDLLELSRLGRIQFEMSDVDMSSMVNALKEELQPRLTSAGIELTVQDGLPVVQGDARWLREVFENLLTNAIKYGCDAPQPSIVVGSDLQDGQVLFFVRDNGSGIDSAHHQTIFEPFRRLSSEKEGSGMGLAIVARIIEMHGGRVWVESRPGSGAAFWISLPSVGESADANVPPAQVATTIGV
ncbi:MAG TPA: HAMP domain-containing sensor histidine kinase [Tepidisphaeraceae bacterium]|nr:HAMP domain-containing sensor histidine kinase [Tepidisphaeraceae bacterium]